MPATHACALCCCDGWMCRYLLLCAPGSKVQQCEQQAPIRQLKPPMQYYSAVQKLCNGTSGAAGDAAATNGAVANASLELELGSEEAAAVAAACKTCSAMSDDPAKVVVQATQANCPDPLGERMVWGHCCGGRVVCCCDRSCRGQLTWPPPLLQCVA